MSFISLRKRHPEPEMEAVEEDLDETEDKLEDEEQPARKPPTTTAGALLVGVTGPGAWVAARFGTGTAWTVHVVAVWACFFYGGWVAVCVVLVWLVAVGMFTPREYLDRLAAAIEQCRREPRGEDAPEAEEGPVADPLVTVLWRLIADAPGVHLKALAEHLQAAAPEQPVDRAAVRAKLTARGIPARASVRDAAGRVNEGVHRDDLTAWQQALSPTGPATPPGARSNAVATAVTCGVADAATGVATPPPPSGRLLRRGGA